MANVLIWDGETVTSSQWKQLETRTPVTHFQFVGREPFQIHRCEADGGIVTESQESLAAHPGHKIRQPVLLRKNEVEAIVEGLIK